MRVLTLLLVSASMAPGLQLEPEAIFEKLDTPEFARDLREILAAVKPGDSPGATDPATGAQIGPPMPFVAFAGLSECHKTIVLPAASLCTMSEVSYACTWETKANKYSVAILQEGLSARIAPALPATWKREKGDGWEMGYGVGYGQRYTDFSDPLGKIVITIRCPIWLDRAHYSSYSATLKIERTELRRIELERLGVRR
jgi:hypothetical protein